MSIFKEDKTVFSSTEDILNRQLHTFDVDDLNEIKKISETIFEPLLRPFRQKRIVEEFSVKQTIRNVMRIGNLIPSYVKREKEHRKSRLVIFMSLSGIDRCSAVSLIPLFSCLKNSALNFRLFIYTDDVVEAEFTHDGFLANDYALAWNNVAAPVVFNKICKMDFDEKEDTFLMIDSLGGGDSHWFGYWGNDEIEEVRREQLKYLSDNGKFSWAKRVRRELNGNYSQFDRLKLPDQWYKLVENNCQKRWMETPALREYMIRWLFNPNFGTVKHAQQVPTYCNAYNSIKLLKPKFKSLHLLTPNLTEANQILMQIKSLNVFDFHHKANTVRGFAEVLSSIVHGNVVFDGPYTKKISYQPVVLGSYSDNESGFINEIEEFQKSELGDEHSELKETDKDCFFDCEVVEKNEPLVKTLSLYKKKKGEMVRYEVKFSEVDVDGFFPENLNKYYEDDFWKNGFLKNYFIESSDSEYTIINKAESLLNDIKTKEIYYDKDLYYSNYISVRQKVFTEEFSGKFNEFKNSINYDRHKTWLLKKEIDDVLEMVSPCYIPYINDLPLRNAVWCTVGKFNNSKLSIGCPLKEDKEYKRRVVWHEMFHWLEYICPHIGVFTNQLIKIKCSDNISQNNTIDLGNDEKAVPVSNGSTPWIKEYAGKWYPKNNASLPNQTEILSVYGEYFTDVKSLIQLMKYDMFMAKFVAFVLMGGPIAYIEAMKKIKENQVLKDIYQGSRKASGYRSSRGWGSSGRGSYRQKKGKGFGL